MMLEVLIVVLQSPVYRHGGQAMHACSRCPSLVSAGVLAKVSPSMGGFGRILRPVKILRDPRDMQCCASCASAACRCIRASTRSCLPCKATPQPLAVGCMCKPQSCRGRLITATGQEPNRKPCGISKSYKTVAVAPNSCQGKRLLLLYGQIASIPREM